VLASIFTNCFMPKLEMTVNELFDADKRLNALYGRHPHVLSNTLRRYKKQGLVYRIQDSRRGRPFYYGMTEKGFKRLEWMAVNRPKQYFFQDKEFMKELLTQIISVLEKKSAL